MINCHQAWLYIFHGKLNENPVQNTTKERQGINLCVRALIASEMLKPQNRFDVTGSTLAVPVVDPIVSAGHTFYLSTLESGAVMQRGGPEV